MPIYEYYCPENHRIYSFLARSLAQRNSLPRCPDDPSFRMEKKISRFAITRQDEGRGAEGDDDAFADVDEGRLAALMEEMEGDLGGLDEEHPDPRKMGKLMRKFGDVLGGGASEGMEEMIRRLEAGEDPDAIEGELGDALDDDDIQLGAALKKLTAGFRPPSRDPVLYELRDYL